MATLTTIRFSRDNRAYEVKIDFDDAAIIDNQIAFDVIATATDIGGTSFSVTLRVELNFTDFTGKILLGNNMLYQFTFGEIGVQMSLQTGEEIIQGMDGDGQIKDTVYDKIQNGIGGIIKEIIDTMPVPDPFFGCLIKATISSIVGQVITCYELRNNYGEGSRLRQILRCLREHVKGIAFRTLERAVRCILRFG